MMNQIILVKTVNDQTYIGVLIEEDEEGLRLLNPLKIEVYLTYDKPIPQVQFSVWDELSDEDNMYLDRFHILYCTLPKEQIINFYNKHFKNQKELTQYDQSEEFIKAMIERLTSNNTIN